jgi:hypothetical protein
MKAGPEAVQTARSVALFVALFATALALGGSLAHALELPNKMQMSLTDYFTVQQIYAGWNRLGWLLAVELGGMLAVAFLYRREPGVLWPAGIALACLVASQVVFWTFTFPVNQATSNWMIMTADWQALRARWEYSHLAGAVCQAGAMAALIVAALRR